MSPTAKVGSVITVPLPTHWKVTSSDTAVILIAIAAGIVTATAVKVGTAQLRVDIATDLAFVLTVKVVA
jgi:hypothetical protein